MTHEKIKDQHFIGVVRDNRGIVIPPCSVLQHWVMQLLCREQGTLLTAIRDCDLVPKYPVDSIERQLTAFVRCHVMVAYDVREIDYVPGAFMQTRFPENFKPSTFGHYPLHYVLHLVHALEIIAYEHPFNEVGELAFMAYEKFVSDLHLHIETKYEMQERLGDDRIASKAVVQ